MAFSCSRVHGLAGVHVRVVQVGQNEVFCQENARQGADGVEGLGEVEAAYARFLRPHGQHEGIAGGFQDGEAARQDENGHQVNVKALAYRGGDIAQRTYHVEAQADQHARLVGKFLKQDGGENRQHRIRPVEGNLHPGGFGGVDHENFAESGDQIVRHIVQQTPQGEAGNQHEKWQPVLLGYDRHGRGTICVHMLSPISHMNNDASIWKQGRSWDSDFSSIHMNTCLKISIYD